MRLSASKCFVIVVLLTNLAIFLGAFFVISHFLKKVW